MTDVPVTRRLVSIICPVFNEEQCVPLFYDRLAAVFRGLQDRYDLELIFTNNRSTDRTTACVEALRARDPRVQLLTLSRNVGYQASVQAGLKQARGEAMLVIDVDCEDPPEMIPELLAGWEEGFDLVYGIRDKRAEPAIITLARKVFYRLNRMLADSDVILDMAEFVLITDAVRDAILCNRSTYPFLRSEMAAMGFARKGIRYDRQPRVAGVTHYSLWRMTEFAVAGILSSTTFPLRLVFYALPLVWALDLALLAGHLAWAWAWAVPVLVVANALYLGTGLAFVALYLARTYRNVVGRPLAVVDWTRSAINGSPRDSPNALPRLGPPR
jgi:dolichol-phosphate mannosyltransferase